MNVGMRVVGALGLFGLLVASSSCSSQSEQRDENVRSASDKLSAQTVKFALQLPLATALTDVAVDAAAGLSVGDRAQIPGQNSGSAPLVEAGAAPTDIGTDAQTGSIMSVGVITLRDRARVNGDATSSSTINGNGATITGAQRQNTPIALDRYSWSVTFPQSSVNVSVSPNTTRTLAAGVYSDVHVFSGSTISLQAGVYFADSLTIEPQAQVALNTTNGPIFIYVRQSLIFRGHTAFTGPNDRLLIGYAGSASPALDTSFNGTLVAPFASVRLGVGGSPYSGAIFANGVALDPDVHFASRAFSGWGQISFDVTPTLNCIEKRADNTFAALLGYFNPNSSPAIVPIGTSNAFSTNPKDRGQPTAFLAGRFPAEFSVDFAQTTPMTWQLDGANLAIATSATSCPGSITASLAQDTTVALSAPTANFGSSSTLTVGDNSDALVQFDRDQVRKTVGVGRYVVKGLLVLAQSSGTQPGIEALAMTKGWTELGATWNCANDTDLSATGQACAPGSTWKLDRDDLTRKNPWLLHSVSRSVVGTYAGGKVTFDVTRDVWNLLGSDGFQHPAAWALLKQSGSIGTAVLASRESGNAPQLVLTLATRPQTAAPLSVLVNTALKPANSTVPPLADGITRTVATLLAPHSPQADFVERELLFNINSDAELPPILARWNGVVVREIRPPADVKFYPTTAVVRIDTTLAQSGALLPRLLKIDNRPMGANAFSSAVGLATMAAAAEEALAGRRVSMNWISKFTGDPSLEDWSTSSIADGAWTGGGPPLSSNAFFWPGFASCDPDPGSPQFPPAMSNEASRRLRYLSAADGRRCLACTRTQRAIVAG